ncbi:hypothetical protein [uncultured Streptomyces sp.]|uniref:hypothetical protein n=1 Tax=uncultured Streptomyces sp. TaxID=174707 RepID=UPI002633C68C|nr:hypothetical protein [uncultured Streptomyces sp.]
MSELHKEVSELEGKSATAARLFDIRLIIGGLFVVYGVIVTLAGISPSDADLKKAEGVHINLWTGLAMLVLGLAFLLWMKIRPVQVPAAPADPAPED